MLRLVNKYKFKLGLVIIHGLVAPGLSLVIRRRKGRAGAKLFVVEAAYETWPLLQGAAVRCPERESSCGPEVVFKHSAKPRAQCNHYGVVLYVCGPLVFTRRGVKSTFHFPLDFWCHAVKKAGLQN